MTPTFQFIRALVSVLIVFAVVTATLDFYSAKDAVVVVRKGFYLTWTVMFCIMLGNKR